MMHIRTHVHAYLLIDLLYVPAQSPTISRQIADERAARKKVSAERTHRAQLQHDCLDVLAIQVRDRQVRAHADRKREALVVEREKFDLIRAEIADSKWRETKRLDSMTYAHELQVRTDLLVYYT